MTGLTIYRGTHQIGGCCTEISADGKRILIDFGANLPDTDETSPLPDQKLTAQVFDGRPTEAVLFTHYHGDHYGLFKSIPKNVPLYIGPVAKQILKALVPYIDLGEKEKGLPRVNAMKTYPYKEWIKPAPGIRVRPLYVDHSALDAYMFYIEAAGKRILFTGDFRDHGIVGEKERVWRTLAAYVPRNIDLLITEGTMLSRERTAQQAPWFDENGDEHIPVKTEAELGRRAAEVFRRSKYNFVLASSTNLDSIMEFYQNTPPGMHFVCVPGQDHSAGHEGHGGQRILLAISDISDPSGASCVGKREREMGLLARGRGVSGSSAEAAIGGGERPGSGAGRLCAAGPEKYPSGNLHLPL